MKVLKVELVTPAGKLFDADAEAVTVPGELGSFALLYNHAPILSTLLKGVVKIKQAGGEKRFTIAGGLLEAGQNRVTILAEHAVEA